MNLQQLIEKAMENLQALIGLAVVCALALLLKRGSSRSSQSSRRQYGDFDPQDVERHNKKERDKQYGRNEE